MVSLCFELILFLVYRGSYLVLVFYPGDWESRDLLKSFSFLSAHFEAKDVQLVGVSTDSVSSHKTWVEASREEQLARQQPLLRTFASTKMPTMSYEEGLVAVKFYKDGGDSWRQWSRVNWKTNQPTAKPVWSYRSTSSSYRAAPVLRRRSGSDGAERLRCCAMLSLSRCKRLF